MKNLNLMLITLLTMVAAGSSYAASSLPTREELLQMSHDQLAAIHTELGSIGRCQMGYNVYGGETVNMPAGSVTTTKDFTSYIVIDQRVSDVVEFRSGSRGIGEVTAKAAAFSSVRESMRNHIRAGHCL